MSNRVWHPYTQMHTAGEPVKMVRGEGAYLFSESGERYIDAVSSWWTNIHGHSHPYIAESIAQQARELEQVIFAGFTHPAAERLAEMLLQRIPFHQKVFYSDNGSTAVEAGLKMALQYWANKGERRNRIIAFRDAYHGDTFGSMSVSARGVFTEPFQSLLFEVDFIDTPTENNKEVVRNQLSQLLTDKSNTIAAFIFEPLVLGSAGMLMYPPEVLDDLIALCRQQGVLIIADEVMTGFGRTGKFLATDYCSYKPDIICLSKGITGGFLPFAATTCTDAIFNAFLSDDRAKMLFHGHSYTGNPLGCAASIASLELFEQEKTMEMVARIEALHHKVVQRLRGVNGIENVRVCGTILALEYRSSSAGYLSRIRDRAYAYFLEHKVILRPLGNTVYVLPPYCISEADLESVYRVIEGFALIMSKSTPD